MGNPTRTTVFFLEAPCAAGITDTMMHTANISHANFLARFTVTQILPIHSYIAMMIYFKMQIGFSFRILISQSNLFKKGSAVIFLVFIKVDIGYFNYLFQPFVSRHTCFSNRNTCPGFLIFSGVHDSTFYSLCKSIRLLICFKAAAKKNKLVAPHSAYDIRGTNDIAECGSHFLST